MRFAKVFAATTFVLSGVSASPTTSRSLGFNLIDILGFDLSPNNGYNTPHPPWVHGSKPGWYYGDNPFAYKDLPCLVGILCKILKFFPYALQCPVPHPHNPPPPPPSDGYTQTFSNITGATQADDFQTFGLVDTVAQCKEMCNTVQGCNFVNSYHDVNGKGGSTQLTCSLFTKCHDASTADNRGGQSQPDGSIDFIINSDGWCKNGVPISDSQ